MPPPLLARVEAAEEAIRALPYEVALAFNRVGEQILRRTGLAERVCFSHAELEAIHGGTLTHNHPAPVGYPDGGSFSLADARLAVQENLAELRAVSTSYRYSLRPGRRAWPSRARLEKVFGRVEPEVTRQLEAAVQDGTLTSRQAAGEREHRAWEQVAVELGLIYAREAFEP